METKEGIISKENELRLTEADLSETLLSVEDVAEKLKVSSDEVKQIIKSGNLDYIELYNVLFDETIETIEDQVRNGIYSDTAVKKRNEALQSGRKVTCVDLDNHILIYPSNLELYLRRKEHDDVKEAFSIAIRKLDLTEEEIQFILDSYREVIYCHTERFVNIDCTTIYNQFRQHQQDHPDDWRYYYELGQDQNWKKPDQYLINKNGDCRGIWDYVNYLKVTGPKKELREFEQMFSNECYPTLTKLLPVPESEDWRWCLTNWGPTYDIVENSTRIYGVRGKNKLFTVFNTEPLYTWIPTIQQKYKKLNFLSYYRSFPRNLWGVIKTVRKNGLVEIEDRDGEIYEDLHGKKHDTIINHEGILREILHYDEYSSKLINQCLTHINKHLEEESIISETPYTPVEFQHVDCPTDFE